MQSRAQRWALGLVVGAVACGGSGDDGIVLENSLGKGDAAEVRFRLTESNPFVGMGVLCEAEQGCDGVVEVTLRSPDACTVIDDPRCGVGVMAPTSVQLASVALRSQTEGERFLPLSVETGDGSFFSSSVAVAFSAEPGEEIDIEIERAAMAPDVTLSVRATWQDAVDPGASELETFLAGVEGMSFEEIATGYPGYRAYRLSYVQPLDHDDPAAGSFVQKAVLHHRDRVAPMVLYTSGYSLFAEDFLAELSEAMEANQLDTEQRFFGTSIPDGVTPADWEHVTIAQAAADHHRFVEALRPFYDGSWVSTGHSKGGMTSIYHRRFFPDDVDATVAYVAPISFQPADPRYAPFLDAIGTDACREAMRNLQREILERFDEVQPLVEAEAASFGLTFEFAGSPEAAYESAVEWAEWSFWQSGGVDTCATLPTAEQLDAMSAEELKQQTISMTGYGQFDSDFDPSFAAYNYQAARELGYQGLATAHLEDLLAHPDVPWWVPEGTDPVHDPAAMQDIQQWVLEEGSEIVFLYGEYDPWTGGAFAAPEDGRALRVTVPQANHGAVIRGLPADEQSRVLDALELWLGTRPRIGPGFMPSRAPLPPGLLHEHMPLPPG